MAPTLSSGALESADMMACTCGSAELSLGVYVVTLKSHCMLDFSWLDCFSVT